MFDDEVAYSERMVDLGMEWVVNALKIADGLVARKSSMDAVDVVNVVDVVDVVDDFASVDVSAQLYVTADVRNCFRVQRNNAEVT